MAPATKMQGFGSDDLGLTKPGQPQHSDIHNKPPPKSLWHAVSRLASTTLDVIKPGEDKQGYNSADAKKAAGDAFLCFSGNCKFTGRIESAEDRLRCPCAGCQSWDNERQIAKQKEQDELEKAAREKAAAKAAQDALDAKRQGTVKGAYVPPSLSLPASEPQSQRRGPWGPAPNERREERSVEQTSPVLVQTSPAVAVTPTPAPVVDLLGEEVHATSPPSADSADLLGGEVVTVETTDLLLGETQESRDLTNLLMSHATADDEDETDLIGLAPTPETKPSEQLDGLF